MKKIFTALLLLCFTCTVAQQRRPQPNPALDSLVNEKDTVALRQKLVRLEKGNENDLSLLIQYYQSSPAKANAILQLAIKKFPLGRYANVAAVNAIYSEKNAGKQEQLFKAYKQKFPASNFDMPSYSVSIAYAGEKNTAKAISYLNSIQSPLSKAQYTPIIAEAIMQYDMAAAEKLVKKELETSRRYMENAVTDTGVITGRNPRMSASNAYYALSDFYAKLLTRKGAYVEALQYVKEAYDNTPRKSDELIKNYAYLLSLNGEHAEAFPMLDKLVKDGKGDAAVRKALELSYAKLHPGENTTEYMQKIEAGLHEKMREEVAKMLISEASPVFSVKDIHGKTVSLADFKGKIIVLDFWATWCGPCKKSFPVMQTVVNKYKNDQNVHFLFIHTWEKVENPLKDAMAYLKDNKYTFDLYMDTKDPATQANPAVTAFGVKGIPAKFVIDGDSNIRFKVSGFSSGEDDKAVAELSAMIELARGK
jgi:thiol-disulfide isomerase/thioredoxin